MEFLMPVPDMDLGSFVVNSKANRFVVKMRA